MYKRQADDPAASAADAADAPAASHDENADDPTASNVEAEAQAHWQEQFHEAPAADDAAITETSLPVSKQTLSPGEFSTSLQPLAIAAAVPRRALCEQCVV